MTFVDSGKIVLEAKKASRVRFTRDDAGKLELRIDGSLAGSKVVAGPLADAGPNGFKIGAWVDGTRWPFVGQVGKVQISRGVVDDALLKQKRTAAKRIEARRRWASPASR